MSEICVGLCTCPDRESGLSIAESLVERGLAACVNILPGVTSVYTWEDKICRDAEVQLVIKSTTTKVEDIYTVIRTLHPYDEPEWLVLGATGGSQSYLDWVRSCIK